MLAIPTSAAFAESFGTVSPYDAVKSLITPGTAGLGRGVLNLGVGGTIFSASVTWAGSAVLTAGAFEAGIQAGSLINAAMWSAYYFGYYGRPCGGGS